MLSKYQYQYLKFNFKNNHNVSSQSHTDTRGFGTGKIHFQLNQPLNIVCGKNIPIRNILLIQNI